MRASHIAPSIPLVDTDWGQMRMAKGDLEGAIATIESAHAKGPHYADPLEMWDEVLIAKNRSDLALAKFEEANKYAPKWAACISNRARRCGGREIMPVHKNSSPSRQGSI